MVAHFYWCSLASKAKDVLQAAHGEVLNVRPGIEDAEFAFLADNKLACVVFDQEGNICFLSQGFERLSGHDRKQLQRNIAWLQSDKEWLEDAVNGVQVEKINEMHDSFFADSSNSATAKWDQHVGIMISCKSNGDPFFCLRHVFCVENNGSSYVVHVLTPVEAAIPGLLWPRSKDVTELAISAEVIETVMDDIRSVADAWLQGTDVSATLAPQMSKACGALEQLLVDGLEGDHFVPRVGANAVIVFEQQVCWSEIYKHVESDLKAAWVACDQQSYMTDKSGRSVTLACAIADVNGADCPLVYVSPGFETLTGYPHSYAQGRNCRFLQPNDRSRNIAFNGPELMRMKEFCTQKREGHIFNLLLNEKFKTGEPFWNLLFMKHLELGPGRQYIFALQTNIELKKEIMDTMVPQQWTLEGLTLLSKLREILQVQEQEFRPSERSFVSLANDITARWIMEFGRNFDCFYEGGHYCPMVGHGATAEFAGKWPEMAEICLSSVLELNKIQGRVRRAGQTLATLDRRTANPDTVVCAVADPDSVDCPLVFISKSFEEMTGYDRDFALGRNCRFLQPNNTGFNKLVNGEECGRMRSFCTEHHQPGDTIMNLLMNERRTGERFWNLLHMTHVETNGKRYILAVQTNLDLPIPSIIRTQSVSYLDQENLEIFAEKLGAFLNKIRVYIRGMAEEGVVKCAEYVFDRILTFMKRNSDDYEGDFCVPRLGLENVEFFTSHVAWSGVSNALGYASEIKDVDGQFYCVSDLEGTDQPLVYVSENFRSHAGYAKEFALGRNSRFQQVKTQYWNDMFNDEENERLQNFLHGEPAVEGTHEESQEKERRGDPKPDTVKAPSQMINVVVHADHDGMPFWCANVSQRIELAGRRYLVTAHWKIDAESVPDMVRCLGEVLAMDRDALQELKRLRNVIDRRFPPDSQVALPDSRARVLECLEIWARRFPQHLQLPISPSKGISLPCVAVELSSSDQPEVVEAKLASMFRSGVRHLHFGFPQGIASRDEKLSEMDARLFDLRIATVLEWMRKNLYMYIGLNVICSVRTPPHLLSAFHDFRKTLKSCKLNFAFWLLDVSAIPDNASDFSKVMKCWKTMSSVKAAGEVKEIGLYGCSQRLLQAVQNTGMRISLVGTEMYPGKKDGLPPRIIHDLRSAGVKLVAFNPFGPRNELLDNPLVQEQAQHLGIEPEIVVLKRLQREGWLSVTPLIQMPCDGLGTEDTGLFSDDEPTEETLEVPLPKFPDFHRRFARQFAVSDRLMRDIWSDRSEEAPLQQIARSQRGDSSLEGMTAATFTRRMSTGTCDDAAVVSPSFCREINRLNSHIEAQMAEEAGLPVVNAPEGPRRRNSVSGRRASHSGQAEMHSPTSPRSGRRASHSGQVEPHSPLSPHGGRRASHAGQVEPNSPTSPHGRRHSASGPVAPEMSSLARRMSGAGLDVQIREAQETRRRSCAAIGVSSDKLDVALDRLIPTFPSQPRERRQSVSKTNPLAPIQRGKTGDSENSTLHSAYDHQPLPPDDEKPKRFRRRSFA